MYLRLLIDLCPPGHVTCLTDTEACWVMDVYIAHLYWGLSPIYHEILRLTPVTCECHQCEGWQDPQTTGNSCVLIPNEQGGCVARVLGGGLSATQQDRNWRGASCSSHQESNPYLSCRIFIFLSAGNRPVTDKIISRIKNLLDPYFVWLYTYDLKWHL